MENDKIFINIWDDFHDDGYVPEGEIQETYAYVECKLSDSDCKEVLSLLENTITQLGQSLNFDSNFTMNINYYDSRKVYPNLIGTQYESTLFSRWQLEFKNLTHEKLDDMLTELQKLTLTYIDTPIKIYSES